MATRTITLTRNDFISSGSKTTADTHRVSKTSDIDLVANDGKCVSVHRIVIGAGSDYFHDITIFPILVLTGGVKEQQ